MNRKAAIAFNMLLSAAIGMLVVTSDLPSGLLVGGAIASAITAACLNRWQPVLALLLIWLVVEDLIRKLAGNDLRVYLSKDLLFVIVIAFAASDPRVRGAWRAATGAERLPLYALVGWAVVMAIPPALDDWRSPLSGLHLNFRYIPLVVAGYLIATSDHLARWLLGIAGIMATASLVGVLQAFLGPSFLGAPEDTRGLGYLTLTRGLEGEAPVYRPSGTFVDPGRFTSAAVVGLAVALACWTVAERYHKRLAALAVIVTAAATWASGGRTAILMGLGLLAAAALGQTWASRKRVLARSARITAIGIAGLAVLAFAVPDMFASRLAWYRDTLNPASGVDEWQFRWDYYSSNTVEGLKLGGLLGQGTGRESLGREYLYLSDDSRSIYDPTLEFAYQVESGYGAVAVEWGWIGLALWCTWSFVWLRRQWRAVSTARQTPYAALGLILFAWTVAILVIGFFGGLQGFQNFINNAYIWLLSGVVFGLPATATKWRLGSDARAGPRADLLSWR